MQSKEESSLKKEFQKILKPTKSTLFIVVPLFVLTLFYSFFYTENTFQLVSLLLVSIFITLSSIQDFQEKMVFTYLLNATAISSIFYIDTPNLNTNFYYISMVVDNIFKGLLIMLFMGFLAKTMSIVLNKQSMGSGDYPIFFAMIILCGIQTPKAFIIMSLTAIMYKIITKEETIPLIPFMFVGIVSSLYLGVFNV